MQAWDWTESQIEQLGPPVATGDGLTEEVTVRVATPIGGTAQKFLKLRVEQVPQGAQSSQFSTRKPGTFSKSTRLRLSSVASWAMQMAAIFKSIVPTRVR